MPGVWRLVKSRESNCSRVTFPENPGRYNLTKTATGVAGLHKMPWG